MPIYNKNTEHANLTTPDPNSIFHEHHFSLNCEPLKITLNPSKHDFNTNQNSPKKFQFALSPPLGLLDTLVFDGIFGGKMQISAGAGCVLRHF
jgi:hypothetical protein